ncbi:MAG: rhodanese-like domain-containing protein, partial [Actinobacteria bacterium]|nr:rhodanese-like domain-containing protein [Actinomycetota bacterium]
GQPIIVLAEPGREDEARIRLARIGFDDVVGTVADVDAVLASHLGLVGIAERLAPEQAIELLRSHDDVQVVDVRNPGETVAGMLPDAVNVPLASLLDRLDDLDPTRRTVVYCAGGYRSSVAASLLRSKGFADVADILGGYDAVAASATV